MKNCAIAIALTLPGCASVPSAAEVDNTLHAVLDKAQTVAKVCEAPVPEVAVKPCADLEQALVVAPGAVDGVNALLAAVEALVHAVQ